MTTPRAATWSIWSIGWAFGPLVLLIGSRKPIRDNSYLWHVTAGRVQLEEGAVLTHDPFSFTALGAPWRTQSWLAELPYAWADGRFGVDVARWIPPLVGTLVYTVTYVLVRKYLTAGFASALFSALTAVVTIAFMNPRPVILSFLAIALVVLALERPRLRWTVPLIAWIWAATHGSFVLCFALLGLDWIVQRRWSTLRLAAASLVSVNLTAHGVGVWQVLTDFSGSGASLDLIQEWRPPDLLSLPMLPVIAALFIVVAAVSRASLPWRFVVPGMAWLVFGLTANRSIPVMWIALLPLLGWAAAQFEGIVRDSGRLPRVLVLSVIATLVLIPLTLPVQGGLDPSRFPIEASGLATGERIIHDDGTGGYLIYSAWPDRLVYVDDRAELFGEQYLDAFTLLEADVGWEAELDRWDFDEALLPHDRPLAQVLSAAGWSTRHSDDDYVLLEPPS